MEAAGLLSLRTVGTAGAGQELDQAISNGPQICLPPTSARQSGEQRRQSLCGGIRRQLRQFSRLLPRIDIQSRQGRKNAKRHFAFVRADRCVEKVVELRFEEGNRNTGRHYDHQSRRTEPTSRRWTCPRFYLDVTINSWRHASRFGKYLLRNAAAAAPAHA